MAEHHHEVCRVLDDLASSCNDSWEGFGKAAKGVHDDELRNWLTEVSGERARFAQELSDEIVKRGGQPSQAGHFGGILHRDGWTWRAGYARKTTAPFAPNAPRASSLL